MTAISQLPGLDAFDRMTLVACGIRTTERLLATLKEQRQRERFAMLTNLPQPALLRHANAADLMRIKGIGQQSVDLLRAAGVSTVRELRWRNAQRLHRAMIMANTRRKISEFPPALNFVVRWIEQAKRLDLLITY